MDTSIETTFQSQGKSGAYAEGGLVGRPLTQMFFTVPNFYVINENFKQKFYYIQAEKSFFKPFSKYEGPISQTKTLRTLLEMNHTIQIT